MGKILSDNPQPHKGEFEEFQRWFDFIFGVSREYITTHEILVWMGLEPDEPQED